MDRGMGKGSAEQGGSIPASGEDRRVVGFFVLAVVISWAPLLPEIANLPIQLPTPLLILVGYGPAIAALIMAIREDGRDGIKALLSRLAIYRIRLEWYGVALLAPAILFLISLGIGMLLGIETDLTRPPVLDLIPVEAPNPWFLLPPVFSYLLLTLLGEEIGWRGYALPRLLQSHGELAAGAAVGLMWGVWHLPMAWVPSLQAAVSHIPFGWFLLDIIAMSILYTWLFVNTKGSLLIALLLHASNNLAAMFLPVLPPAANGIQIFLILLTTKLVLAGILLIFFGSAGWRSPTTD